MSASRLRGGLILQLSEGYRFVGSDVAQSVIPAHPLLDVPGLAAPALGLSLVNDKVVAVLSVGSFDQRDWVLCHLDGDFVALSGARVLSSGLYPCATTNHKRILWQGQELEMLDVRALHLSVEQAIWRARAARDDSRNT